MSSNVVFCSFIYSSFVLYNFRETSDIRVNDAGRFLGSKSDNSIFYMQEGKASKIKGKCSGKLSEKIAFLEVLVG